MEELPPEVEYRELATILTSGDPGVLSMAKSLLEEAGIQYWSAAEGLQDLFGLGRLGTGFNVAVGLAEIRVAEEDAEEARRVLAGLPKAAAG